MFEQFTDRARKVVVLAQEQAQTVHSSHIGSDHLLLAILTEGQSLAAQTLAARGVQRESLLRLAHEHHIEEASDPDPMIWFSAWANEAISFARSEAHAIGHDHIAPEHLLLGLMRLGDGAAASVLADLSMTGIREVIIEEMTTKPGVPSHLGPCTRCGASIVNFGKVQEVELHVEDRSDINVYAYYCGECKSTYGLVKGPTDDAESA